MDAMDMVKKMPEAFDPDAAGDLNATVQYQLSQPMTMKIADGACNVSEGEADDPDVTLIMEDEDFVQLMTGELNGMTAFMTGKLKVEGDLMLAQRLSSLFDADRLD